MTNTFLIFIRLFAMLPNVVVYGLLRVSSN
jgi:hypothetical protein